MNKEVILFSSHLIKKHLIFFLKKFNAMPTILIWVTRKMKEMKIDSNVNNKKAMVSNKMNIIINFSIF